MDVFEQLSPVPWENVYHLGIVVHDIERAMDDIAAETGISWAPLRQANVTVKSPDGRIEPVGLQVVYSRNGPPFMELIQAKPGTIWTPDPAPRLHHMGVYVDDLVSEVARLERLGMVDEAHGVDEDGNLVLFSYLSDRHGFRIELVDAAGRQNTLQWVRST